MTVDNALKRLNQTLHLANRSKKTIDNYDRWIKRFFEYYHWADVPESEITVLKAQEFLSFIIEEKEAAVRTSNVCVYALRQFFDAVLLTPVSSRQLPVRRCGITPRPVIKIEQVYLLLEGCHNLRLKAAVALAAGCGLRAGEVARLRFKDFNKYEQTIMIWDSKGSKSRLVQYSPSVSRILNEYASRIDGSERTPDSYLFKGKRPGEHCPPTVLSKQFTEYLQTFPFYQPLMSFHSLRHAYATALADSCTPIPLIQKEMGHASPATTANYIHTDPDFQAELPDILDKAHKKFRT